VSPRLADRQRAFLDGGGSHVRSRSAERTRLAGRLHSLSAVSASRTGLAFSLHCQLLSGAALVPALFAGHRLGCPGGLPKAAQQTGEAALVGLVKAMAAAAAETSHVVVVFASRTTLLAVRRAAGSRTHRHAWTTGDHRAGAASQLTGFALVIAHGTRHALSCLFVVISAHRARYCKQRAEHVEFAKLRL